MTHCQCPSPIRGPATLTEYTGLATVYAICLHCGLPIVGSGMPERLYINAKRQAMKATAKGE